VLPTLPTTLPQEAPPLGYPGHFPIKRLTESWTIRLRDKLIFLAKRPNFLHVGLEETDDGIWSIHFANVLLAKFDEGDMILRG